MDEKVLTYAEIQAIAAGRKEIKERIETENALAEMNMLRREWGYEKSKMREMLEVLPINLEKAQNTLAMIQADMVGAKKVAGMEELPFDNKKIHANINRVLANFKGGNKEPIPLGTVAGFSVSVMAVEETKGLTLDNITTETVARIMVKGEAEYSFDASLGEHDNNVVRIKNVFTKIIPAREENSANEITRLTENIEQAHSQMAEPFEHEQKIVELEKKLAELDAILSGLTVQEDVVTDPEETDYVETAEQKSEREKIYNADDNDYQAVPDDDEPDDPQPQPTRKIR